MCFLDSAFQANRMLLWWAVEGDQLQIEAKHNSTHSHTKLLTFGSQASIVQKVALTQKVEMLVTDPHETSTFSQLWTIDSWPINKPENIKKTEALVVEI